MARQSLLMGVCLAWVSCGGSTRFPLRDPMLRDDDQHPFSPEPEQYISPFAWDAANQTVFRPISRWFAVDPAGRATNVNSFDEVPDSSWFTNRLGRLPLTTEDVARGSCAERRLDPNVSDGSWVIDQGKTNGANPGFRIKVEGLGKFMLKSDPKPEPERATGATAIATRIYHALGYFAPCDTVVYFRPSVLKLKGGLQVTNNQGVTTPFDQQALDHILTNAAHRNGLVRMVASEWLPGKPLGPYAYQGIRRDDPNDVVPHEDRRELRGARLVAAWLNHFDSREQNTMDVFMRPPGAGPETPGYVRHYIMDLGDCFGSIWTIDALSRQFGHAYMFDASYILEDFVTLGTIVRPWERAQRTGGPFNYFSARDFDPELWRGEYPNPAFARMTEGDGAWMARILAHFDDQMVEAVVEVGLYEARYSQYLTQTLVKRRDAILRRYLGRLSPITNLRIDGDRLCGEDLARKVGVAPREASSFRAQSFAESSGSKWKASPIEGHANGSFCVQLPHVAPDGGPPDTDASRYLLVDITNGHARGPLRAHLYDLGSRRGFRLVGIERPEEMLPSSEEK